MAPRAGGGQGPGQWGRHVEPQATTRMARPPSPRRPTHGTPTLDRPRRPCQPGSGGRKNPVHPRHGASAPVHHGSGNHTSRRERPETRSSPARAYPPPSWRGIMARTHATAQAHPVPPADHPHFAAPSFPLQCVREERGVTGHAFMTGSGRRHHSGAVVRAGVRGATRWTAHAPRGDQRTTPCRSAVVTCPVR